MKAFYERAQPRDSDPIRNFGERDLVRLAEDAGFAEIRLDFEAEIVRGNPPGWGNNAWDIVAKAAPNPLVPSLEEVAERVLSPEQARRLLAHLRPLIPVRVSWCCWPLLTSQNSIWAKFREPGLAEVRLGPLKVAPLFLRNVRLLE